MPTTITVPGGAGSGGGRTVLTANSNYYVATAGGGGSDSNPGTIGSPFLTIQKAVNVVSALDMATYQTTINVADGTYAEQLSLPPLIANRYDPAILLGDETTPGDVIIDGSGGADFGSALAIAGNWKLSGFKTKAPTDGTHLLVTNRAQLKLGRLSFDSTGGYGFLGHGIIISTDSSIISVGNLDMLGTEWSTPFSFGRGSRVSIPEPGASTTLTISGTPAWPGGAAFIDVSSSTVRFTATISGTATGQRYYVRYNGVLNTGGGATYLPGDVAGVVDTGGQYD